MYLSCAPRMHHKYRNTKIKCKGLKMRGIVCLSGISCQKAFTVLNYDLPDNMLFMSGMGQGNISVLPLCCLHMC